VKDVNFIFLVIGIQPCCNFLLLMLDSFFFFFLYSVMKDHLFVMFISKLFRVWDD
jgi:hypothetical protein